MLPPTEQGFTGHRQMDALGIVHMKGRIYDPTLGRFLQADPFVQAPKNSQNYNRYSYVLNNPMSYTDPSGYFFKALFDGIKKYWRQIVSIAVMFIPGINVIAAGFISGYIATGSLKGAIIGAFTAGMAGPANTLGGFITNGVVGGLASKAMGGKFGHGFWSAGIGASLSGSINGIKSAFGRVVVSTVVGGTISNITGGKFANGAFDAAFARTLGEFGKRSISNKYSSESTTSSSGGTCSSCGQVTVDINGLDYNQLDKTMHDLGEFIGNEYVEQTSLSRALSTVGSAMYDMRVTQITNFDIQHTRMRRSMNEPWDYALDKFNTVGQAASFCGHIICQGVSYGAAGVDYMRTGNAAGIQGNLLNESFSNYINSRFRWLPKPVRDFMSGGTSYMSGEMVKDK